MSIRSQYFPAAMVAEVVPEKRRVEAGALLYTAAPLGLFLATFVNFQIAGSLLKSDPEHSWRFVFLAGLIPAAVALVVRRFVREPERWRSAAAEAPRPRFAELFDRRTRALTLSGFLMAVIVLVTWVLAVNHLPPAPGYHMILWAALAHTAYCLALAMYLGSTKTRAETIL